uniref:Recep_L_domain domain-containing protein n=1 Tax=Panagrellus redivivus TaxID=6233 RepID=A0A7E4ZYW8_PANRE
MSSVANTLETYGFTTNAIDKLFWFLGGSFDGPTQAESVMTVANYVNSIATETRLEGETFFGFRLRNLGLTKSGQIEMNPGFMEVLNERCTVFWDVNRFKRAILIIYDGDAIIGVLHKENIYEAFGDLPSNVAEQLMEARFVINQDIVTYECLLSVNFVVPEIEFSLGRNGKIKYYCQDYKEPISPGRNFKDCLILAKNEKYLAAYRMFMLMPFNMKAAQHVEINYS